MFVDSKDGAFHLRVFAMIAVIVMQLYLYLVILACRLSHCPFTTDEDSFVKSFDPFLISHH